MRWQALWRILLIALVLAACDQPADSDPSAGVAATVTAPLALSDEDQAYLTATRSTVERARQALTQFATQEALAKDNPSLLSDTRWRQETAATLLLLEQTGQDLQHYSPVPPDLTSLNEECVALGKDLVAVATDYSKGVDESSLSRAAAAVDDRRSANARLQKIAALLEELR